MTDLEIVQEARKVVMSGFRHHEGRLVYNSQNYNRDDHNSWIAHKAFFERHKATEMEIPGLCHLKNGIEEVVGCVVCNRYYPCLELVEQAKAIMGVKE